jgi:hypothetical protein
MAQPRAGTFTGGDQAHGTRSVESTRRAAGSTLPDRSGQERDMTNTSQPSDEDLVALYRSLRTIAVVGASADETKPAYLIPVRPAAPQR